MATYPQPVKREIPFQIRNEVVNKDTAIYDSNGILTSAVTNTVGSFTTRKGDSFTSGSYDYTWDITDLGREGWSRNYKAATVGTPGSEPGEPINLSSYAKLASPMFTGKPTAPEIDSSLLTNPDSLQQLINLKTLYQILSNAFALPGAVLFVANNIPKSFNTLAEAIAAIPGNGTGGWHYAKIMTFITQTDNTTVTKSCEIEAIAPASPITASSGARVILRGNLRGSTASHIAYCSGAEIVIESDTYYSGSGAAYVTFPAGKITVKGNIVVDSTADSALGYTSNNAANVNNKVIFNMTGNITVLQKGSPLRATDDIAFRGNITSFDKGVSFGPGRHHFYATTFDMSNSTNAQKACLILTRANGYDDPQITALHAGCTLISPANVPAIVPNNGPVPQFIFMSQNTAFGSLSNSVFDPLVSVSYLDYIPAIVLDETGGKYKISVKNNSLASDPI